MKLFLFDVHTTGTKRRRRTYQVLVHAKTEAAATAHLEKRFTKCAIDRCIKVDGTVSKHFNLGEIELA